MYQRKYGLFAKLKAAEIGTESLQIVSRPYENQYYRKGNKVWYVKRLHELAKDLPIRQIPIEELDLAHIVTSPYTLPQLAFHIQLVMKADLQFPILLGMAGNIMDGRHRITKCIMEEREFIDYQKFDEDPAPDYLTDDA